MQLDQAAVRLRSREPWEAADLGTAMLRAWWRAAYGAMLIVVGAFSASYVVAMLRPIIGPEFSTAQTGMVALLGWCGVVALTLIASGVIFGFELGTFFSVAMIALAGGAVLHDTSKVLHHLPEDRYVAASLELFASVALMFWYVLRLYLRSRD